MDTKASQPEPREVEKSGCVGRALAWEPETCVLVTACLLCLLLNPLSLVSTSTNWKHPALGCKTLGRM